MSTPSQINLKMTEHDTLEEILAIDDKVGDLMLSSSI
jgi:hypothetical protein